MSSYLLRRRRLGKTSCEKIAEFSTSGIGVYRNDAVLPTEADWVFRWGCTSNVPTRNVVNTTAAIHLVSDKVGFRKILDAEELCPKTWTTLEQVELPCIVRPQFHHGGYQLFVCRTEAELAAAVVACGDGWYASRIINKVAEYRVYVAQGRVPCVARKYPKDEASIAWNVSQGGRYENVRWNEWPLRVVKASCDAMRPSGLDFGGVDVMVDAEGGCFVLEINSAPSLFSEYRQRCLAKVFDGIVEHGKEMIPMIAATGGYRKFVHPAVCAEAILV